MIDVPIQVKDALREGRLRKNYRFQVLNDDGTVDFTIDNDNLVSESVNIDERMCSGDKIEYGLCEGSSLEFQYFGKDNITGRQLKVFLDVEYGESTPYAIPMGYFTVKNCSRQASTGIIKAVCYNKLQSDYLDAKANELLENIPSDNGSSGTSLYTVLQATLNGYGIEEKHKEGLDLEWDDTHGSLTGYRYSIPITFSGAPEGRVYYPVIYTTMSCQVWSSVDSGKVLSFDKLADYLTLLGRVVQSIHDEIFSPSWGIQNPTSVWSQFLSAGLYYCGVYITYTNGRTVRYVPPELCESTSSYLHFENIENLYNAWNADFVTIYIPYKLSMYYIAQPDNIEIWMDFWQGTETLNLDLFENQVFLIDESEFSTAESFIVNPKTLPDVTLRELQSAVFETECQFGKLDRETDLFSGVELNRSRLLPADTLYPDNALYPDGAQESAFRSQYSKLWADEGNVRKWRYLIITYKGLDENQQETEYTLQRTVNADGTDDYNCSDNWLFRNLVWTAADIGTYADAMVLKMQDITWFPFEMWCAGLPYLETGDEIEIPLGEDTYTSYILQRQLKGIQNLQDTYINGTLDIF